MSKVTTLDIAIIILYLFVMLGVGLKFIKRVKNREDFYSADHSIGTKLMLTTVCATIIGGSSMMGRAGLGYTSGIECLMTALPYMTGMFLFSAYAGRIYDVGKKHGITSIPSLFEFRFGKAAKNRYFDHDRTGYDGNRVVPDHGDSDHHQIARQPDRDLL